MTALDQTCEVCKGESGGEYVGVAAIPGHPVSVSWCRSCLREDATPAFIAEYVLFDLGGGSLDGLAPWVFEQKVWHEGKYLPFREWAATFTPEQIAEALAEVDARDREIERVDEGA